MMESNTGAQPKHAFIFFVLACALSWVCAILSVRNPLGLEEAGTTALDYAAKYGPTFAGIIMAAVVLGRDGVGDLMMRTMKWRVHPGWYLFAFGVPIVATALGAFLWTFLEDDVPAMQWAAGITFIGWFMARFLMGGGLGEELGWRGFMLPALQDRWGALGASVMIGVCWGVWHFPAFFIDPEKAAEFPGVLILMGLFTLYNIVLSIIFTYLYNGTGGSVFMCVVMHATFNGFDSTLDQMLPGQSGDLLGGIFLLVSLAVFIPLVIRQDRRRRAETAE